MDGSQSTREVILDTAERLFAARGIDGVAVRDLARATGLTASSLYNHFPSKQALYDAVLERGLRPIVDMTAEALQPGAFEPDKLRGRLSRMVNHLAKHPNIAPLLQRALLEDGDGLQSLVAPWLKKLHREGVALVRRSAGEAGWAPEELPHLMLALFGMMYGYFINAVASQKITPWSRDPLSSEQLAVQRQFQEKAIARMLGPWPQRTTP